MLCYTVNKVVFEFVTLHADRDLGPLREMQGTCKTSAARTASLHIGVTCRLPLLSVWKMFCTLNSLGGIG